MSKKELLHCLKILSCQENKTKIILQSEPPVENCKCPGCYARHNHVKISWHCKCCVDEVLMFKKENDIHGIAQSTYDIHGIAQSTYDCPKDYFWKFIQQCLDILLKLADITEKEEATMNVFGVKDSKLIADVTQLVMAFGLLPNLLEGVGIANKSKLTVCSRVQTFKLYIVVKSLVCILRNCFMHRILFTLVHCDILAALIQLSCRSQTTQSRDCCCYRLPSSHRCSSCSELTFDEKSWCKEQLDSMLIRSYQPVIIKNLLTLQRGSPAGKRPKYFWYQQAIGRLLSQCLLKRGGVKAVVDGILEGCDKDLLSWQRCEAIGTLISKTPEQAVSTEKYFNGIIPQMIEMMALNTAPNTNHLVIIARGFFQALHKKQPQVLLESVRIMCGRLHEMHEPGTINFRLSNLCESLQCLVNLSSNQCGVSFIHLQIPVLSACFTLYCLYKHPKLNLLHEELLRSALSSVDSTPLLHVFMFNKLHSKHTLEARLVSEDLEIILTDENDRSKSLSVRDISTEMRIDAVVQLLKQKSMASVRCDFFADLLTQLVSLISRKKTVEREETNISGTSTELLLIDSLVEELKFKIELVSIISAFMDTFGDSVLQNTPQIVDFVKNVLTLSSHDREDSSLVLDDFVVESENTDLCLMLLSTLLASEKLTSADFDALSNLLPALRKVSCKHKVASSRQMANDLHVFVSTRGVVSPDVGKHQSPKSTDLSSNAAYREAMRELADPLIPTRGHALLQLTKLIRHRNAYAMKDADKLLDVFEANVAHDDTYLYLAAIEGLKSLVEVDHVKVLPVLCAKFAQFTQQGKRETFSVELRMKICEAIVKSCHVCADLLPYHSHVLFSSLFVGVKDAEASVRACSLSAIGDVFELLGFAATAHITEIVSCIQCVVTSDESSEVRRASVQVFSLLFKGMSFKLLQMMPERLLDVYRLLRKVYECDVDELTRLHAGNALNILDDIMKESAKPLLLKKIQVLS